MEVIIVSIELIITNNFYVQNKSFILIVWCDILFSEEQED